MKLSKKNSWKDFKFILKENYTKDYVLLIVLDKNQEDTKNLINDGILNNDSNRVNYLYFLRSIMFEH